VVPLHRELELEGVLVDFTIGLLVSLAGDEEQTPQVPPPELQCAQYLQFLQAKQLLFP